MHVMRSSRLIAPARSSGEFVILLVRPRRWEARQINSAQMSGPASQS
jgi:hypothetical protein